MDAVLLKYHLQGNDYLVYDTCQNDVELDAKAIRTICARNFGAGSQGILAGPVLRGAQADVRAYRPDGSETVLNRSAADVFSRYLRDAGYLQEHPLVLHTGTGNLPVSEAGEAAARVGKLFLSEEFMRRNHFHRTRRKPDEQRVPHDRPGYGRYGIE